MEFSVRSFAVVSLLLLVFLSTDMSGPLVVDATSCDWDLCQKYCSLLGKSACCPGPSGPCRCTGVCPRSRIMSGFPPLCDYNLCEKYCSLQDKPACCEGLYGPCRCQAICPLAGSINKEITEEVMVGTTVEEPLIK